MINKFDTLQLNVLVETGSLMRERNCFHTQIKGNSWNLSSRKYMGGLISSVFLWWIIFCIQALKDGCLYILSFFPHNCKTLSKYVLAEFQSLILPLVFFSLYVFSNLRLQLFFISQFTSHGSLFKELPTTHASVLILMCSVHNRTAVEWSQTHKQACTCYIPCGFPFGIWLWPHVSETS